MANIRTAMNRGAFDFLTKPIDFPDLETTIAKTLRHSRSSARRGARQMAAERAHASLSRYFSPNLAERLVRRCRQRRPGRPAPRGGVAFHRHRRLHEPGRDDRAGAALGALLNEYLVRHDRDRLRPRGHRGQDHRRRAARAVRRARANNPIMRRAPSLARSTSTISRKRSGRAGGKKGIALGATRIGVHAGPAIVGNFGGGRFFDYTAYGDTINIAARLEAANKQLGTRICVSASVARQRARISAAARSATSCSADAGAAARLRTDCARSIIRSDGGLSPGVHQAGAATRKRSPPSRPWWDRRRTIHWRTSI